MLFKNAIQKIHVYAYDATTGAAKTGDANQITGYVSLDGTANAIDDLHPAEVDVTNLPGVYAFDLTAAETNCESFALVAKSSTSNIRIDPIIGFTAGVDLTKIDGKKTDGTPAATDRPLLHLKQLDCNNPDAGGIGFNAQGGSGADACGIRAEATNGVGLYAYSYYGKGLHAYSPEGIGLDAYSDYNIGMRARGSVADFQIFSGMFWDEDELPIVVSADLTKVKGTAIPAESVAGRDAAALGKLLDVATPVFTAASVNQTADAPTTADVAKAVLDLVQSGLPGSICLRDLLALVKAMIDAGTP
jgi:hypothetical protein